MPKGAATKLLAFFAIAEPSGEPRRPAIHEQSIAIGNRRAATMVRPTIAIVSPIGRRLVSGISIVATDHSMDTQIKHM
jgi:hypothetical protein